MGKLMETIFCICYIIAVFILGGLILAKGKNKKEFLLFGIMVKKIRLK